MPSTPDHSAGRWFLVAICFLVLSVSFSARSVLGLTMPYLESDLDWSRGFVSTGGAVALVVMAITAPLAGNLLDRFGARPILVAGLAALGLGMSAAAGMSEPWQLIGGFSLMAGVGFGLAANHVVSTVVSQRFEHNRGLAVGIATSGSTAGQLLLIPILAWVLASASWRWSFLSLGLVGLALAGLVYPMLAGGGRAASHGSLPAIEPLGRRLRFLWGNRVFQLLFWGFVVCGFTTTGVIETHLLPYATACGFPPLESATAYGLLSAFNLVGMLGAGWLADRVSRPLLLGAIYILRGLSFILLMNITGDLSLLLIFAVAFGVLDYSTLPVVANIVANHLGLRIMGLSMGLLSAGHALGGAVGAFMGGVLYDLFAQYEWVWAASVALAIAAGFMSFAIRENNRARPTAPVLAAA